MDNIQEVSCEQKGVFSKIEKLALKSFGVVTVSMLNMRAGVTYLIINNEHSSRKTPPSSPSRPSKMFFPLKIIWYGTARVSTFHDDQTIR